MENSEMNQAVMKGVTGADASTPDDRTILSHLNQLNSLLLVRMINPLIIACQQHRGASAVLLEGNTSFKPRVESLQKEIFRRIQMLKRVNQEHGYTIPERIMVEIELEWEVLAREWSTDTVITNFDFHSHFIEKLLGLTWDVTQRAGYFMAPMDDETKAIFDFDLSHSFPALRKDDPAGRALIRKSDHHAVVTIVVRDIPGLIETMAKVRGLASHAAVMGCCDKDHQQRLSTLLVEMNHQKERLIRALRPLQHYMLSGIPALVDTLLHEHKLSQLPEMVNREILGHRTINIDSQSVFSFVTEIIEIYYTVIEQGIILIQRNNERVIFAEC